jgi:hypothetical protein
MTNRPRNRIVIYRLTQDEYQALKEACGRRAARSLSDFTRCEVLKPFLRPALRPEHHRSAGLKDEIAALKDSIANLNRLLEGPTHVEPNL